MNFEAGQASLRYQQDKENELSQKLNRANSKNDMQDDHLMLDDYKRRSQKAYTQVVQKFGYDYPDPTASPINANLSQNMLNIDGNYPGASIIFF